MKKVTEQDLNQKVGSLRNYMNVIEATAPAQSGWDQFKSWATTPIVGDNSAAAQGAKPLSFLQPAATAAKPTATPPATKPQGSEELKQTQRMLNSLTGANLTVDGVMGPKTQAAYDAWKAGTAKQAAAAPAATPAPAAYMGNALNANSLGLTMATTPGAVVPGTAAAVVPGTAPAAVPAAPAAPAPAALKAAQAKAAAPISETDDLGEVIHYNENKEHGHVTFGYDQELARIISLSSK